MATNQEVIDRARTGIPDVYKRRVTDTMFLGYLKDFLLWLFNTRPDWFIGQFSAIPTVTTVGGTYPLEDRTIPMAELYLIARAEYPENQNVAKERVTASLGLLQKATHA